AASCRLPSDFDTPTAITFGMSQTSTSGAGATRTERDSMGEMQVPADAYYGASTGRAVENFPISDLRLPRRFIEAMGLIKYAAARVNAELGAVTKERTDLIERAAREGIRSEERRVGKGR